MSDVTLLRKLTRKSILKFGQYADVPIQSLIDLNKHKYLRWIYFNSSNIDFMEDILDDIKIPLHFRFIKPAKNPELHLKLNQEIFENLSDDFKEKFLKKSVKIATKITKAKSISKIKEHEKCFKKDYLRRKNQGNQLS
jgi:hypothetical protein